MSSPKKFRALNSEGELVYFTIGELLVNYCDEGNFNKVSGTSLFDLHEEWKHISQFTGLKDKNGKEELWEGDICRDERFGWQGDIVWDDDTAGFFVNLRKKERRSGVALTKSNIEMNNLIKIGNIYKNPELVEEVPK